jgi:putative membrane protein
MRLTLLLTTAAALALSACGSRSDAPDAEGTTTADATIPDEAVGAATGTAADTAAAPTTAQGFADAAAASDMFEIESSRLAQTMAKNQAVKDFAAMLVTEHTKSSAELKAAAAQATPAVTVTPKLTPQQQSDLDALKNAGANFDTLYAQKQVPAHEKALAMLQGYAANGDSAPLKAFASKTAPVVQKHLDQARKLPK